MKLKISILLFFNFSISAFSQVKRDYIWLLGGNRNPTLDTSFQGFQLDFNTIPRSIYIKDRPFPIIRQNNASICDRNGNLMMYTAGCWISDRLYRPMPNGKINEGFVWDFSCNKGDYASFNATLFLSGSHDDSIYFLLHKFTEFDPDPKYPGATHTKLLLSTVDLRANGGYGDIIQKNVPLLEKYLSGGDLTAVRHANGKDWWIAVTGRVSNSYFAIHLSDTGRVKVVESVLGPPTGYIEDGGSQSCFSPDGKMFARMGPSTGLFLLDFDRVTGVFSNIRTAITGKEIEDFTTGACFSPNSRYLYITTQVDLWQLDTRASDLQASLTHIDTWDGYVDGGIWAAQFNQMVLGPDCKIYMNTRTSNLVMHLIHSPNEPGKACGFEQHGLKLPARNHASIPNFVHYRLGYEPICDSTLVWVNNPKSDENRIDMWCHPNPARDLLQIRFDEDLSADGRVDILTTTGTVMKSIFINKASTSNTVDVRDWPAGVYMVRYRDMEGRSSVERLVVE